MSSANPPAVADLEKLERMMAAATPGPWRHEWCEAPGVGRYSTMFEAWQFIEPSVAAFWKSEQATADAELVVALRNAAPALLAELRRLRGVEERARALMAWLDTPWTPSKINFTDPDALERLQRESAARSNESLGLQAALRAALEQP